MKSWKFKLGIVAVFVLGAVVGVVATSIYFRNMAFDMHFNRPEQAVAFIMNKMDRKLSLTPDQRKAIEPIVADSFTKMRQLRSRLNPEVEALMTQTSQQVKQHLTPEQQVRLDEYYAEALKRWRMFSSVPGATPPSAAPAVPASKK